MAREGKVWLLKKIVYGLPDASKSWYTRVKEELLELNVKASKYALGLFMYQYGGTLNGLLVTHVDDFLYFDRDFFITSFLRMLSKPLHKIMQ